VLLIERFALAVNLQAGAAGQQMPWLCAVNPFSAIDRSKPRVCRSG
jgi:hypothetical protein